jgi:hypothetical protein
MHAILIDIDGPSFRQHVAEQRAATASGAKTKAPRGADSATKER